LLTRGIAKMWSSRMLQRLSYSLVPLLFTPCFLSAQPEAASILERLDRLERENRELAEQVRALRAEVAVLRDDPPAEFSNLEEKLDIQEHRVEEQAETKVESSQRFPIRLTGMALFNAFLDSRQNGGADYPTIAAPTGPGRGGAAVRQTILGLEFHGPQAILGGRVHGSIYMDFFAGSAPLHQTMRLRTASIQVDWSSRHLFAGIAKPIFNPREPDSLAQVGVSPLAGAGNLWLWLPQVRFGQDFSLGRGAGLRAEMGAVATRELGPYRGSPPVGPIEPARPGLEGRFEFFRKFDDERRIEIAPGFHVSTTHVAGRAVPSQVFSLDWFFNPVRRVELSGAFYRGQNVAHLGTGAILQGFTVYEHDAEPVASQGGWGQVTIHALPRLDVHLFSGQQDDRNADLITGGIGKNLLLGGNLFFRLAPNVLLGPEVSQVRTISIGMGTRLNNHYDLALAYQF
jgi:hypothetical protein